ncbi:MAG: type I 3-dehydroquinate dehydratase [bacterium (Candidatus Ratteibacteria) CG_4_10_14_3_um_filter_41_18]|uniref:3-dehydroquinate dehydratase n=4 Tax=Candidatus Ratteibacteria TaxID=2979319 RepID=A0A2M7YEG4_9BACT|nr:MAG: type I 3-dehydroquinate dehydratase [Candidatus Omnitrophica bacterium CG1_02_41_171]PIV64149.1 MAG: type I 3-dehydroquinate dehydratase [bacterium (Candidatus Ratteibacteria) CG01_land_8_20_14_3_00_40_19]PIW33664.1 MAG: type I 3-dehydroquinate dehydratase [bacterium (Candidatus Ratteibacteria) CG15_BIG_FIL_POST_REV_8_21_14_020_41_12]PIW74123.1 MAG: type I 3-dehydroquinate dehydratase [bacterium (Candidatus Ratteibacteria) CG_4_8_14_3_um_filter_41_36]PIX76774.1 MAG: type I 3-dehydroquin
MIKIGKVKLGKTPKICLTLCNIKDRNSIKKAKFQGADLLELRIDQFQNLDEKDIIKFIRGIRKGCLPLIATVRSKREGGRCLSDTKRLRLFKAVIPLVDAVDVELSSRKILNEVVKKAHHHQKIVILSYHNFKKTPVNEVLEKIIKKIKSQGGDIVKVSTFAKKKEDVIRLLEITLKYKDKNIIAIAMGKIGAVSRVFFPFIGSLLTYGYVDTPSAPGQFSLNVLREEIKRFDSA